GGGGSGGVGVAVGGRGRPQGDPERRGGFAMSRVVRHPLARAPRTAVLALLAFAPLTAAPARAELLALTGGTVHTVSGANLDHATVLVDGARITAVGANVAAPHG